MDTQELEKKIIELEKKIKDLSTQLVNLTNVRTISIGTGNTGMKCDKSGLWFGKKKWEDIDTTPPLGTGISMEGELFIKDGVNGSFAAEGGSPVITVKNGYIISIA